ncbi:MAG: phospho-sugar mutase [Eubacterium sp.]|nr:phospho-sugar mutase [Eubacterium sp.]
MADYIKAYESWVNSDFFDEKTKAELQSIAGNEKEIKERFFSELEFGTAGLRGVIGAGTNRMNIYVVARATQGLANYILSKNGQDRGVAIAFDCRHFSPEFADIAARVLAANGIKSYRFESLRPTPELSFAVRYLGCIAGINVTASHNPPEYNGYKVYWEDGAQITPPNDIGIMLEVRKLGIEDSKIISLEEAKEKGLYNIIGKEVDDAYIEELKKLVIHKDTIEKFAKDIKIVYSPLHGTGNIPARRILAELGFENVYVVKEQELPDGDFPTVDYPNPEAKEAFKLALDLAKEKDADLVLATDPDADRLGVYVKDTKTGEYMCLTGNMSGSLLAEYELSQIQATRGIPKDGRLIKTIVTTNLAACIADHYGVKMEECLTGFKFIGQKMLSYEHSGVGTYLFGFEESYGCLIGTHARDKDAIVATMALCEAATYYRSLGKTLWDAMIDMYDRYGYWIDDIKTITMKGVDGVEKIKSIMSMLRKNSPKKIGDYEVIAVRDYDTDIVRNLKTGAETPTFLPKSNVLYFELTNDTWLCVRPSGTEPKIKFYFGVKGSSLENAKELSARFAEKVSSLIENLVNA